MTLESVPCPHGQPGGETLMPSSGLPRCPFCRTGTSPAEPRRRPLAVVGQRKTHRASTERYLATIRQRAAGTETDSGPGSAAVTCAGCGGTLDDNLSEAGFTTHGGDCDDQRQAAGGAR